ncbi:hypothetical protein LTAR_02058 [Leptolinea tardivitalis]|nr:hypothetical protein LTAR_02058 [Leptolinea tardivitalis]
METSRQKQPYTLASVCIKTALIHTVSYFLIGLISFTVFDYSARYADPLLGNFMRQTTHPMVAAGPLFQILRGLLFGLVFFTLRDVVFARKRGWLTLWLVLLVVGIISPFGPSPSSIEGMVYTTVPLNFHVIGLPEVIVQSLVLAVGTFFWVNHPEKKWIGWVIGIVFAMVILMAVMGILSAVGILVQPK